MSTVKIISPSFVNGFVKECFDTGLLEKEAAALLDGYIDATVTDQMEKKAGPLWRWLREGGKIFKQKLKPVGEAGSGAASTLWNIAKFPATWPGRLAEKHKGLGIGVGLTGMTAAYGAPIVGLDYYRSQGDGAAAEYLRQVFGDKSLFGFGPKEPEWNGNEILNMAGGALGSGAGGEQWEPSNPYSGPFAKRMRPTSSGSGGSSFGGSGSWMLGSAALGKYDSLNSNIKDRRAQIEAWTKELGSADPIARRVIQQRIALANKEVDRLRKEVGDMQSKNNSQISAYQIRQRKKLQEAQKSKARDEKHLLEQLHWNENMERTSPYDPRKLGTILNTSLDEIERRNSRASAALETARMAEEGSRKLKPVTGGY